MVKSEKLYTRRFLCHLDHHRRFPTMIIGLGSRWKQQRYPTNPTKTKNPIIKNGETKEIEKGKHSTSTGRPVCGSESTISCVLMPAKIEEDQTRTARPVKVEEHDIDFRVPGLSHAVVKEAEHLRVEELVKKIENHHHREALQADLQQNNVYNPFSNKFEGKDPRIG